MSSPGGTSGDTAEPNVILGTVATSQGDPISGARIRIVGYTGGASLGQEIETVLSGADGRYRYAVPRGLYEALGEGDLEADGQTYVFDLEPVDGDCEQQMSDAGIVKDFVLRLTGLKPCRRDALPDNYLSYHGAAIQLIDSTTAGHAQDAVVSYRLEPMGPLADDSPGTTLTLTRTIAGLHTSAGPIEGTWILHDIPLARYRLSATLREPGGADIPVLVATLTDPTPAPTVDVTFDAREIVGSPAVGYSMPQVQIHDPEGFG